MAVESIPNKELDRWIENLSNCKQLEETEVKRLTDKVSWPKASSVVFVGEGACNGVAPFLCRTYKCMLCIVGEGDITEGVKCSGGQMPGDRMWRCTWPIP